MSLSIFSEKAFMPNDEMLRGALQDSGTLWDSLKNHIISAYKSVSEEWKFYSRSAGWTLVVKSGKRTLLYLVPLNNCFKVNFVFGEKAVGMAQKADLPEQIVSLVLEAKPHMEGRSFMVDVKTAADVAVVAKLLDIKNNS